MSEPLNEPIDELLDSSPDLDGPGEAVAIVGMAGRFPGAADLDELWRNLRDGVESISTLSDAELLAAGVSPALLAHPRYVKARGVLSDVELFDAPFFGFSPREAAITDPQHRVFLECAWEALEQAGVDPETWPGRIGVYAGSIVSTYLLFHLFPRLSADDESGWQTMLANDKDALATRVSYKLNLKGPSLSVQTACSTSLVAVHMARQSLLDYECDLALAGGVSVRSPQNVGYLYQEAGIHSPDGRCRPFDARARGTVFSGGAGIVVLKRLSDALSDGDTIRAVLVGSAINNDGAQKVGFTAPSVEGQAEVIARALALGEIDPETIQYVEAHGTATPLGDPIEIAALTRAFRASTDRRGFCAVGSIKSNIGHLDTAAGIAGLIKTVLALEHREIPPSLHFERPNPQIDFAGSPFFVNDRLRRWERGERGNSGEAGPRRAGVSSFGIGGTNAHVVLEEAPEAPETPPASPSRPWQLLVLSAKTETALSRAASRLAEHLERRPDLDLADVAHTLQLGRRAFPFRRALVCGTRDEARAALAAGAGLPAGRPAGGTPAVAFLFPGQGSQRLDMGRELYGAEPLFRCEVDRAAEILRPHLGEDLRALLFPAAGRREEAERRLGRTALAQPALFVVETALARLWMSWGVRPQAMLGHSLGEYVAAHLAGVLSLEDALALVAARGRLVDELPGGAMLAVPLPEGEVAPLLGPELAMAAVNTPLQCVVSGPEPEIEALRAELLGRGIAGRRLATSHAFHSRQMDGLLEPFVRIVRQFALHPPEIPYLSNVSGRWVTAEEATDPGYWARHLRQAVRFADGISGLLAEPDRLLLEVGPGHTLTRLARRQCDLRGERDRLAVASWAADGADLPEPAALLTALGRVWAAGVPVDWTAFRGEERRRRVSLPTYPFERRRHWIEAARPGAREGGPGLSSSAADPAGWFHLPSWRRSLPPGVTAGEKRSWLLLGDGGGLAAALAERIERGGEEVVRLAEGSAADCAGLLGSLREEGRAPRYLVHLRSLTPPGAPAPDLKAAWEHGLADLVALSRALAESGGGEGATVVALSNGAQRVTGQEELCPVKATLLGWVRTAPAAGESPRRRSVDVVLPGPGGGLPRLAERLFAEIRSDATEPVVAYRGSDRWVPALEPAPFGPPPRLAAWRRADGWYLVTGGLDGLAQATARWLAAAGPVRLALVAPPQYPRAIREERVRELAASGAEVRVLEAAPADREALAAGLAPLEAAWGAPAGVFHLPGQATAAEWMEESILLNTLFGCDRPAGFMVFFSWFEPPPGARFHPEVWAASALLDALAHEREARGAAPTIAVDWAGGTGFDLQAAFAALDRILSHLAVPQIVVALPPAVEDREAAAPRPEGESESLPDDPLSRRIAAIWQQTLGVERIGPRDRFFDLGGDSLIAVQVLARLRDAFPVELPVAVLFERPTIPELRDALEEALTARAARENPGAIGRIGRIGHRQGDGPAPLSSAQQRLWFLDQLSPQNPAYNVHALARLRGQLDRAALARAFREIVERHEALRTVFRLEGGEPFQAVLPRVEPAFARVDLSGLPAERRRAESAAVLAAAAGRGFDLGHPPLLRATLLDLAEDGGEHLLLVVLHHAISDGWSMGVLLQELATLYTAAVTACPSPLAPLPLQYADYAAWQRRSLEEGAFQAALGHWCEELRSAPESLDLPADRPRPPLQSLRGAACPVILDPAATAALATLARQGEATLFMALFAAFAALLGRYSGQEDILVGSPVAGRGRRELEGLIGLFVNTVVLRADLSGEPSYRQLLGRARATALRAYAHQDLPFERLVEEVKPGRDLARTPLFQVMFALQNTPVPEFSLPGLTLRQEELESATSMFDLALSLRERDGGVAGSLRYATDLFEAATASRLLGHFGRLLAAVAAEPDRPLSELSLLTPEELQQLRAWNDTAAPLERDLCLHRRIAAWAASIGDAPAVVCGEEVLSYGELDRRADRLARRLRRLGAGPDVPVGICARRSPALLVGILGILKSGAAYVPLDESYPTERLALMVADSRAPVIVTAGQPAARLRAEGAAVVRLDVADADWPGIAAEDGGPLDPLAAGVTAGNLAYIIYTSGSTGRPKGVACRHLSAVNLMTQLGGRGPLSPGDAASLWTSVSFDVSVTEIFTTLGWGGSLHLPTEEERASAEALLPWMARHRIVSAYLPPFLLGDLARWVSEGGAERRTLRRLWVGVEPIRQGLLAEIRTAVPELLILNGYGPTEATVCNTLYDVDPGGGAERRTPLGHPIGNCRIHLLDRGLQEVPIGVPGEIWLAGDVLARGYFGRPDLTAEKFVPDPIGGHGVAPGGRCYRTGDLARRLPSGDLEFVGRRDQQVKVRGFRIELEEIEVALALQPGVREAIVAVREDPRGDKHLVAYVLPHEGADLSAWRDLLGDRLPAYMVPTTLVHLPALPLSPSGKVDRRALPEPDWSASQGPFVAPRGPVETRLAEIWSDLLGGGPVSGTDDFFARGGHSLLATRVVARVRERFAVELPLREIFEARTLAAMAARIEALREEATGEEAPLGPVGRGARRGTGPLPLSFAQQRLWFMDQLEPGSVLFNTPGALRLIGPLSPGLLQRTVDEVVRRHEILRTTYLAVDGQPIQVIAAELSVPMPTIDLTALPVRRREEEMARAIAADVALPFNLAKGPVLRTTLLLLGSEEHVLLLNLHHIAEDRWSQGIFRREIAALYEAWSRGEPSPLPDLPLQYADFALWQRRRLTGELLDSQVAYWKRQLEGAPQVLDLPTDRPRPLVQSHRGRWRPFSLPAERVARLTRWGNERGGTLFMTLLSALAATLGRLAGQEELLVGSPIAGRERPQLEGLIGIFVNTLVLRVDLSGNPSFDRLLDRVRAMALDAYAHPSLPFERLVDELAPARDLGRSPLFQAGFALQNVPTEPLRLSGLTLIPLGIESGTAQQDLLLLLSEADGALAGFWEFAADLFDGVTIDRWTGHLTSLLAALATGSGRPPSELPFLSASELQQVRLEWNETASDYPREARVEELFAALAAARPEAPAIIAGGAEGEVWSYRRLDEAAARLAARLLALGVGTESRVGIAMERSPELIVALLAILKAGGVYVPLDPGYPDERLAFMIGDSELSVALVHAPTRERLAGLALPAGLPPLHLLPVDGEPAESIAAGAPAPETRRSADELAYVTYTSGSTGRPKGVAVPHRAIVRLVRETNYVDLGPDDRLAHISNISFDAATFEIWGALANGGAVVVIGKEVILSPADFAARLRATGVTAMFVTAALFNQVVREEPGAFSTVRHLLVGGEALDPVSVGRALAEGPPARLLNGYGPTESTTFAVWHEVREVMPGATQIPIGRPLANTTAYVLDRWHGLASQGQVGELLLGGDGLARGYLNRPGLTAERFVPHPWGAEPGERLYRTGDLVRRRADGAIEYVGRVDQQVKIRGHRIEPGEIEAVLAEQPGVEASAVVVREDPPGGKALVAYVVGSGVDMRELRELLSSKLPAYMVPAAFVHLEALPLTHHGKLDRAALPAPERPVSDRGAAPPRTPAEVVLADIWSGVLGRETVGIHDNFFELGGDSILCVQVVSRALRAGLEITPRDLFQHQTVAELAAVAGGSVEAGGVESGAEVPPTPIQRWFLELSPEDPHHFNQNLVLDLRRPVDAGLLAGALALVAGHHEALGFRFLAGEDGTWRQVAREAALPLAAIDLSALPGERRRPAFETAAGCLAGSLDLARGPLFRASLFALGEEGQRLLLVAHHLIVDAVSWRVLLADLEAAYSALATGREVALTPAGTPFRQWSARLAEHARSPALAAELGYWLGASRAAIRPLPVDPSGGANTVATARTVVAELAAEETQALLQEIPAAYRTRVADALLSALVQAFAAWTGEPRLLVDLEGHGREELFPGLDVSRTVGWFTAVHPVLLELDRKEHDPGDPGKCLKAIKEQLWAVPRGGIGYGLLRYLGGGEAAERLRDLPAAEVLFNYLGELDKGEAGDSSLFARAQEAAGAEQSPRQRRSHLLEINAGVKGGRLRLLFTYSEARHERRTVEALAERSVAALRALVEHCRSGAKAALTPADFPAARVSQKDLDKLMARIGKR